MLPYVGGAHAEYSHAIKENKKTQTAGENWEQERCRFNIDLKNLQRAKTESMTVYGKEMNKQD